MNLYKFHISSCKISKLSFFNENIFLNMFLSNHILKYKYLNVLMYTEVKKKL